MISLDGYFEGPDHDISWHNVDREFNTVHAIPMLAQTDTIIFGRRTYELMASYWPTKQAKNDDTLVAKYMNQTPKIVFSHKLNAIKWQNTKLINHHAFQQLRKLKASPGKNIILLGSNNLAVGLMSVGLIDEFRIMINPIVIGGGTSLFTGLSKPVNLRLIKTRKFKNGNILLTYSPR